MMMSISMMTSTFIQYPSLKNISNINKNVANLVITFTINHTSSKIVKVIQNLTPTLQKKSFKLKYNYQSLTPIERALLIIYTKY